MMIRQSRKHVQGSTATTLANSNQFQILAESWMQWTLKHFKNFEHACARVTSSDLVMTFEKLCVCVYAHSCRRQADRLTASRQKPGELKCPDIVQDGQTRLTVKTETTVITWTDKVNCQVNKMNNCLFNGGLSCGQTKKIVTMG